MLRSFRRGRSPPAAGFSRSKNLVSIKVVNQPDMDTTSRVETDGTISFPYVGRIRAAGLSEDQVARAIEKQLAARQIATYHRVPLKSLPTARKRACRDKWGCQGLYARSAHKSHSAAITGRWNSGCRAGWDRDGAPAGRRHQKVRFLKDVQAGRGPGANLQIANNDEVFVDLAPFYYIYGYVGKTGEYPLVRPITVQQAISIGGGLAVLGSEWRIKIKRRSGNGETYEVPASLDDQVEAGDTIIVSERIFVVIKFC